jgi:hypothetical protein
MKNIAKTPASSESMAARTPSMLAHAAPAAGLLAAAAAEASTIACGSMCSMPTPIMTPATKLTANCIQRCVS